MDKRVDLTIDYATVSERGLVRGDNQDAVLVDAAQTLFCVADGMGGGAEGATASRFVREELAKISGKVMTELRSSLDRLIVAANARILRYAQDKDFRQMGSTVALIVRDPADSRRVAVGHVGDSRVYRVRGGSAELLTADHTIGGQLSSMASGDMAESLRNRKHPLAHVLTRAIGVVEKVEVEWLEADAAVGDRWLVCTDGVHDVLADSLIGEVLAVAPDPKAAAKRLEEEVVRAGAPDNYSYVIVFFGGS